ncbi:hypothetical protein RRG08_059340 [Elysia crispata]|uniref:Uncharacterized protein n=1 Tax=Elysia crispata TaxID=231223 RepID=A0AAE1BEJ1_9GAST|nr:hypothetical protein RRG08_059340 [Elysia crispata]
MYSTFFKIKTEDNASSPLAVCTEHRLGCLDYIQVSSTQTVWATRNSLPRVSKPMALRPVSARVASLASTASLRTLMAHVEAFCGKGEKESLAARKSFKTRLWPSLALEGDTVLDNLWQH